MPIFALATAMTARPRAPAPAAAALRLFDPACRPAVARLAARDARLADLAVAFPALLHRLGVRPDAPETHAAAALVARGASLKEAAAVAGVPYWARRLPPEAFGEVAPELPDGVWFGHRIVNHLPRAAPHAARWLAVVNAGAEWGEKDLVLWLARECARAPKEVRPDLAPLLALFAWFSRRPGVLGGSLGEPRWTAGLRFSEALERSHAWLASVTMAVELGARVFDPWLEAREIDGFAFEPLVTREQLVAEARAMRNCLRTYGCEIAHDWERIWSVRREGKRVATLSVGYPEDAPFPQLLQLKGPGNEAAAPEVWFAARRWISAQAPVRPAERGWGDAEFDRAAWLEMWKPYWLARGRVPARLPLRPSREALRAFYGDGRRRRRRPARRGRGA